MSRAGRMGRVRLAVSLGSSLFALGLMMGCRDLSRYNSDGGGFAGPVVAGDFVRAGIAEGTQMCVTLDTNHLQDAPGTVTTSDGRFTGTPLRPIPQIWNDPLSTLSFGEGRIQNYVYVATPDADADVAGDIVLVLSLMQSSGLEVRTFRGAPAVGDAASPDAQAALSAAVFGVFRLERQSAPCVPTP